MDNIFYNCTAFRTAVRHFGSALSACFFITLACTLCTAAAMAQPIVYTPQWIPQSQFAGYYVAAARGFYKDAGLDVRIEHPSASNSSLHRLQSGASNVITLQLIAAMKAIDEGTPLINILQTSQNNSLMIVARDPIRKPEDLKGKKVGRWKAGFSELGDMINHDRALDIEWIPFVQNVNLFTARAIDATLAMSYNEYFQILSSGARLRPENIFYFADLGYNLPEDGLYVTADYYRIHRDELDKFAEASRRGWLWAVEHPKETLDIVMVLVRKYQVGTNVEHQKWMLREVLRMQQEKTTGCRSFTLSPEALKLANRLLLRSGLIKKEITYLQITEP